MKKGPPALLVGACLLWIAYDVGSGAIPGIAEVDQRRLDETPMSEIVRRAVEAHKGRRDSQWTKHAIVRSVSSANNKIKFQLMLTRETEFKIGARMTQAKRADIRQGLRTEVCHHDDLEYLLARGGAVEFRVYSQDRHIAFDANASGNQC